MVDQFPRKFYTFEIFYIYSKYHIIKVELFRWKNDDIELVIWFYIQLIYYLFMLIVSFFKMFNIFFGYKFIGIC